MSALNVAYKKTFRPKKTSFMTVNQRMYRWADNLFFDELISGTTLHTLKAIIATRHLKQATIQQINDARSRSASTKFAQSDSVTNRTIIRHIQKLEKLGYIKVHRHHFGYDKRNSYSICVPDELLVNDSSDIMSLSISCDTPTLKGRGINHNYKNKTKRGKNDSKAPGGALAPNGSALPGVSTLIEPEQPQWQKEALENGRRKWEEFRAKKLQRQSGA